MRFPYKGTLFPYKGTLCSHSAPSLLCNLVPVCSYFAGAGGTFCWSREVTAYVTTAALRQGLLGDDTPPFDGPFDPGFPPMGMDERFDLDMDPMDGLFGEEEIWA